MKEVKIDREIESDPGLLADVQRANASLEDELGGSAGTVSAAWTLRRNARDELSIRLTIRDWTGQVHADFALEELESGWRTKGRLIRLWGDLLQIRSHHLLDEIRSAAAVEGN